MCDTSWRGIDVGIEVNLSFLAGFFEVSNLLQGWIMYRSGIQRGFTNCISIWLCCYWVVFGQKSLGVFLSGTNLASLKSQFFYRVISHQKLQNDDLSPDTPPPIPPPHHSPSPHSERKSTKTLLASQSTYQHLYNASKILPWSCIRDLLCFLLLLYRMLPSIPIHL